MLSGLPGFSTKSTLRDSYLAVNDKMGDVDILRHQFARERLSKTA